MVGYDMFEVWLVCKCVGMTFPSFYVTSLSTPRIGRGTCCCMQV